MSGINSFLGGATAGQDAYQQRQSAFNAAMMAGDEEGVSAPRQRGENIGPAFGRGERGGGASDLAAVFAGLDPAKRQEVKSDLSRKGQIVAVLAGLPAEEQVIGIHTYGKEFGIDETARARAAANPAAALAEVSSSIQQAEALLEQVGPYTAQDKLFAHGKDLAFKSDDIPILKPENSGSKSNSMGSVPQEHDFNSVSAAIRNADEVSLPGKASAMDGFVDAYGDPYLSEDEGLEPALLASKGRGIPRSIVERLESSGRLRTTSQHRRIEQFELYRSQIQKNDPLNPRAQQSSFDINYVPTARQVREMEREAFQAKHFRAQYNQIESYMEHSQGRPNNFTTNLVATEAELYRLGREFVGFGSNQNVIPFNNGRGLKNIETGREFRYSVKRRKLDQDFVNYQGNFIQNVPRGEGNSTKKNPQINVHVNTVAPMTSTQLLNSGTGG